MGDRTKGPPGRLILAADDDESARKVLSRVLTRAGYDVRIAVDGNEARNLIASHKFDAIVSDISMPGLSGIDLLRAVRGRDLDVPVVLVTANPTIDTASKAIEYGALRYLTKPFTPQELLAVVAYAVQMHDLALTKREALGLVGEVRAAAADRAGLEATFDHALGTLRMDFQPIVSCSMRSVHAHEALMRCEDGAIGPVTILDAAERLGRVHELGRAVRERVAESVLALPDGLSIFVNLHPQELEDDALYSARNPLWRYAKRVVLEITERARLDVVADLDRRTHELRQAGFRFAVDDLGAGYAGLASFVQLRPEVVKIDRDLVCGVQGDLTKQRLIHSIRCLCTDLGIAVIAEGVEEQAERVTLEELGVDLLQGYAFARPQPSFSEVPPSAFGKLIPS